MCSKRLTLPKLGGWVADLVCNDRTRTAVLVSNFFSQISSLMREIRRYHINFATFLLLDCEFHFDPVKSTVCAHISPRCKSFTLRKNQPSQSCVRFLSFFFVVGYNIADDRMRTDIHLQIVSLKKSRQDARFPKIIQEYVFVNESQLQHLIFFRLNQLYGCTGLGRFGQGLAENGRAGSWYSGRTCESVAIQ